MMTSFVQSHGAIGNGVANDRAAMLAADAQGATLIAQGSFRISASMTFVNDVEFALGGKLIIPDGVTITFNGQVRAGVSHIFQCSGTGRVVFNRTKTWQGFPEWWGAKADLSVDCLPMIHAARDALLHVQLQAGDYRTSGTIKWTAEHRRLQGVGEKFSDTDAEVTRIVCDSATADIIQFGPDTQPPNINAHVKNLVVRDVYLGRFMPPAIASGCRGINARWTLYGLIEGVKVNDCMVGFRENGTVHLKKKDCEAVRATAGTGAGVDYFVGHWADGSGTIGTPGGNASLYHFECAANCNITALQQAAGSIGFKATGAFTDLFYRNPETTHFYLGQAIYGTDAAGLSFSNVNCIIEHPIHDQFHHAGIYITDVAEAGSVEIQTPYFGPANDARAAYWVNSSRGAVTVRGGQFVMGAAPAVQPIIISASPKANVLGFPAVIEAGNRFPIVGVSDSANAIITVDASNPSVSAGAVVQLSGSCTAIIVEPKCSGKRGAFEYGIQVLGAADSRCEYRVTGIDSATLVAANRKLNRNGKAVTAVGYYATNYATGVFT